MPEILPRLPRQASEQYFTSSHTFSHFLRQTNGRPQVTQTLEGRSAFARILGIPAFSARADAGTRARKPAGGACDVVNI